MAVGIYKKGQGYWTRLMSAIALGLVVLLGVIWLWDLLAGVKIGNLQTVYIQATAAVIAPYLHIAALMSSVLATIATSSTQAQVSTE